MTTFSTSSTGLRYARMVFATLMLTLAGGAMHTAMAQPGPGGHGGHGGFGWFGGPHLNHMLDSVNATDAQRTQIREIARVAQADLAAQHHAGAQLHEQTLQIFTQPTVDANAAEALRQQMLQQHDQASRRVMQAMLDISRVLTPEQRTQLGEQMRKRKEMRQRHMRERSQLDQPGNK